MIAERAPARRRRYESRPAIRFGQSGGTQREARKSCTHPRVRDPRPAKQAPYPARGTRSHGFSGSNIGANVRALKRHGRAILPPERRTSGFDGEERDRASGERALARRLHECRQLC